MAVHPRVRSEHDTLQSPVGSPLHEWAWVAMDYQTILTFPEHRRILCARLSSDSGSCDTSRCRGPRARGNRAHILGRNYLDRHVSGRARHLGNHSQPIGPGRGLPCDRRYHAGSVHSCGIEYPPTADQQDRSSATPFRIIKTYWVVVAGGACQGDWHHEVILAKLQPTIARSPRGVKHRLISNL